jgi:hypothetical protein
MIKKIILTIFITFFINLSFAGTNCENLGVINNNTFEKSLITSQKVINYLNDNNAQSALVGRVGQNLSEYHLKYSHIGIFFKENNEWFVYHELNKCATSESFVFKEGVGNFFLDDMYSFDAIIYLPSPQLQEKIVSSIKNKSFSKFHTTNYNMTAFPFSTKYQNSNQFILESVTSLLSNEIEFQSREDIQNFLKLKKFQSTTLEI